MRQDGCRTTTTHPSPRTSSSIRNLAFSDFNQQVATAIAGGTTPDLMIVDNPNNASSLRRERSLDLTSKVQEWGQADQFLPGPWNSTQWDGKTYGIPLGSNTVVLWINTDLATGGGARPGQPAQDVGRLRASGRRP